MTPDHLRLAVRDLDLPAGDQPETLLRALEQCHDARPGEPAIRALVLAAHGLVTASDGLDAAVCGVTRERLVRWDAWTTTWCGARVDNGERAMVRVLRPHASRDPVLRRTLAREGRALARFFPMTVTPGPEAGVVAPLPGPSLAEPSSEWDEEPLHRLTGLLGTALIDLEHIEGSGCRLPPLDRQELVLAGGRLVPVCLTVAPTVDWSALVASVASALASWWADRGPSPILEVCEGLTELPPATPEEARQRLVAAMAEDLAARRHALVGRGEHSASLSRRARLQVAVERLAHAMPPPNGAGAVGVDLDGNTTVVRGAGGVLGWGTDTGPLSTVVAHGNLDVPEARRLLRARNLAPSNPRLDRAIGGDPAFTDHACRWVRASLDLRTVRLLLGAGAS